VAAEDLPASFSASQLPEGAHLSGCMGEPVKVAAAELHTSLVDG
jgi:hypothetical protein